jgi:hypothetical protein
MPIMGYMTNLTLTAVLNNTKEEKAKKIITFGVIIFIEAIIWVVPWRIFVFSSLKKV